MRNFKIFNLIGEVNENMELEFSRFVDEAIITPDIPILILINSCGGSVSYGFSIYNKIRALPNPVYTLITSCCHSIANIIYLSVPFESRFAFNYTSFFIHPATSCSSERHSKSDYIEEIQELEIINSNIREIINNETKISNDVLDDIFIKGNSERKFYSADFKELAIGNLIINFYDIFDYEKNL